MTLWFGGLLLAVGLFTGSSALTEEECKAIVTPLPEFRPMYGRWTFVLGYSDNPVFDEKFKATRSQWIDFIHSPTDTPNQIHEDVGLRLATHCKYYSTVVNIVGNSGVSQRSNFTCTFHSLPTCSNCLLYHTTSINNNNLMAPEGTPTTQEELRGFRAFYLMATKPFLKPEDLAHAKKQAECLGFTGEPTFHYDYQNNANRFCDKARGD